MGRLMRGDVVQRTRQLLQRAPPTPAPGQPQCVTRAAHQLKPFLGRGSTYEGPPLACSPTCPPPPPPADPASLALSKFGHSTQLRAGRLLQHQRPANHLPRPPPPLGGVPVRPAHDHPGVAWRRRPLHRVASDAHARRNLLHVPITDGTHAPADGWVGRRPGTLLPVGRSNDRPCMRRQQQVAHTAPPLRAAHPPTPPRPTAALQLLRGFLGVGQGHVMRAHLPAGRRLPGRLCRVRLQQYIWAVRRRDVLLRRVSAPLGGRVGRWEGVLLLGVVGGVRACVLPVGRGCDSCKMPRRAAGSVPCCPAPCCPAQPGRPRHAAPLPLPFPQRQRRW